MNTTMKIFGWDSNPKDIDRQIAHFVKHKAKRGIYTANNHQEWLLSFAKVIKKDTIFDITEEDKSIFADWVGEKYNGSQYCKEEAQRIVKAFLTFYKIK